MPFDFDAVKDFLRCPQSRSELVPEGDALVSTDPQGRLKYPVRDGIPILLIDDAESLPLDEWSSIMERHGRNATTGQPQAASGTFGAGD